MDAQTQAEYDRIKAGPHSGVFTFLHHEGLITEKSADVMERVEYILKEKQRTEHYTRLRHIYWLDISQMPPNCQEAYKVWEDWEETYKVWKEAYKVWEEAYKVWEEAYKVWEVVLPHVLQLVPNCGWDGKTIFGK